MAGAVAITGATTGATGEGLATVGDGSTDAVTTGAVDTEAAGAADAVGTGAAEGDDVDGKA